MTKTEFYQQLDEILLTGNGSILLLLNEYDHVYKSLDLNIIINNSDLVHYLLERTKQENYHLLPKQTDELWEIASFHENIDLINVLLKIQDGKCSSNNLIHTLNTGYAGIFEYIFHFIDKYPDIYRYEPDDNLYDLLKAIVQNLQWSEQGEKILRYFLGIWTSSTILEKDLNQLMYYTLTSGDNWYDPQIVNILSEFGANPLANYYEEEIDTGNPIIFQVIRDDLWRIKPLFVCRTELKNWNTIDEWGRNLLHYATDNREIYRQLLEKGVDPDHRALIDDEAKVVVAKMNGTLPKEYGKTPRELIEF